MRKSLKGAVRALPIPQPRRAAQPRLATYASLAVLLDTSEAIASARVRPKTDAAAILLLDQHS